VPIYDYVCGSCSHRFEVFRGLNEAGPHVCPVCGGPVTRAFAPPTIHFKGSGWAKVDRRYSGAPTKKAGGEAQGGELGGSASGDAAEKGSRSGSRSSGSGSSGSGSSESGSSGSGDSGSRDSRSAGPGSGDSSETASPSTAAKET
jgi:putative FmdB family regulatory protein